MKLALTFLLGLLFGLAAGVLLPLRTSIRTDDPDAVAEQAFALARAQARIDALEAEVARREKELEAARALSADSRISAVDEGRGISAKSEGGGEIANDGEDGSGESSASDALQPPALPVDEAKEAQVRSYLESDDPRLMLSGLQEIALIGDDAARVALASRILNLEGQPPWLTTAALRTLAELGGPDAVAAVAPLLESELAWLASAAIRALSEMGEPTAIPALRAAFDSADPRQKIDIAVALRELGDPELADQVARQISSDLSSPDERQRAAAVLSMWQLRDTSRNTLIVGMLADESSSVRQTAASVLGQQGTAADIPPLQLLLLDSNVQVRIAARRAIDLIESRLEDAIRAEKGTEYTAPIGR